MNTQTDLPPGTAPLPTSTGEEVKTCATTINKESQKTTDSSPINGPEKPLTNSASDAPSPAEAQKYATPEYQIPTPDTDALHAAFMEDRSMPSLDAYFDLLALARKLERERAILKTRINAFDIERRRGKQTRKRGR
jgi:hypothetical protein